MFEHETVSAVDDLIELRAQLALAEIRHMAERARDEIDIRLGLQPPALKAEATYARSFGQLKRWARTRARKGAVQ